MNINNIPLKKALSYLAMMLMLFVALTPSEAQITTDGIKSSSFKANSDTSVINGQVKTLKSEIARLQKLLVAIDNNTNEDVRSLIQNLPATHQLIAEQLNALTKLADHTVNQNQLEQFNSLSETVDLAGRSNALQLEQLSDGESTLHKVKNNYESLKQLLSNPVHQSKIDAQLKGKTRIIESDIALLQQKFSSRIEELSLRAQELEKTDKSLSNLQKMLSNKLIEQQKNVAIPPPKNNQISDKSKTLQLTIEQLQEKLTQQRNNIDLQTIESLQQQLYEKKTLLWLLGVDEALIAIIENPTLILDEYDLEELNLVNLNKQHTETLAEQEKLAELKQAVEVRYVEFQKHTDITGVQPVLEKAFTERLRAIAYQRLLLQNQPKLITSAINDKKQAALFSMDDFYAKRQFIEAPKHVADSLVQIAYQIQISFSTFVKQLLAKPVKATLAAILGILFTVTAMRFIAQWAKKAKKQLKRDTSGMAITLRKLLHTLRKNGALLTVLLCVLILVNASEIPYPSNTIICTLIYAVAATVIWLTLMRVESKLTTVSKTHIKLGMLMTIVVAFSITLYAIAYMTAIDSTVLSLYEKLLMFAVILFVGIEREKFALYLAKPSNVLSNKAYTLYRRLLGALPWSIIALCLLNLIGFSRLSWLFLSYLGVGMLYIMLFVLGMKLINYLRKKTKLYALKRFNHGAFVATDMVSPLSTVCKVLWAWATTAVLFIVMGWDSNSYLIADFLTVVQYPLVTVGNTALSLQTIALAVLAIYAIFKIAKWLRTFSYHWLYARIHDLGVRGSLSIFTQYVATVIGLLIALNVLGIDLTSLAVFAGALGVGIGLGLQDTAKNFISGILLLIERPLRNGDWVSIDGNEGTVKSIGMRAITMETFDKQEVIIPNGNVIGNSFINNTHSDSILRTVLYVGAGYESDPNLVIDVLKTILEQTDNVLTEPVPQIVLWEYADSSINYRIQYYINIDHSSILGTRTEVLNQIWHAFKANQIEIPFPQRDINFRNRLDFLNQQTNDE